MTPLPRWVFLCSLLAVAVSFTAHREHGACARLCRAQKRSTEKIGGVCDYERPVLQSDGGDSAIQRLFRLCLTPCRAPVARKGPLAFVDSEDCRSLRDTLLRLERCSCNHWEDGWTRRYEDWKDSSWIDEVFKDYFERGNDGPDAKESFADMTGNVLEEESSRTVKDKGMPSFDLDDRYSEIDTMDVDQVDPGEIEDRGKEKFVVVAPNTEGQATATTKTPDAEYPVDWELWCMAQCDNGQGGSACECDIIP